MNDIIKAIQKHEVEVSSQAIDKLVEEFHKVLGESDADLLEGLEVYLGNIVSSVKDNLKEESKKAAKAAAGKKTKDPNAPKRPPSEYNIFIKEHIATLRETHADAKPKELMSMAVDEWRAQKERDGAPALKPKPKAARKILSDTEPETEPESDAEPKPAPKKISPKKTPAKK